MFKPLIEKCHAKPQIGLEEGVQVMVLGLNRLVLMSVGLCHCSLGYVAGEKDM